MQLVNSGPAAIEIEWQKKEWQSKLAENKVYAVNISDMKDRHLDGIGIENCRIDYNSAVKLFCIIVALQLIDLYHKCINLNAVLKHYII